MCGIVGACNLKEPRPISCDLLKEMVGILHHRGPDESGIYLDGWAGLGHARLSIIDLSTGSQPIHNEDETLWIVLNGEIFNYLELRKQLRSKGHRFYTTSDTEVILHLYEEEGPACVNLFNGQFAFAIWDSKNRKLFLARDRVGIRPLHYTLYEDVFYFASEIKSLFLVPGMPRELDLRALNQIFTFWTTLPGWTVFKNIHELLPGHTLVLSNGELHVEKYWDLPFRTPQEQEDYHVEVLAEKIRDLLIDAVRIRLRADVPVGSYLSGGLDSSGVASIIRHRFNSRLKTFGIRFEEADFDEGDHQSEMVSFLNTDHASVRVNNYDIARSLPDVIWHCEKPLLRTAPVPLYLLSRIVHDGSIKVVLTGEGGDEVFGGYNIFREAKARLFLSKNPKSRFRSLPLANLYPYIFKDSRLGPMLQSFFSQGLDRVDDPFFSHLIRWRNTARIKRFFCEYIYDAVRDDDPIEQLGRILPDSFSSWDYLSKAQYLEMVLFMSNYLLSSQGDRVAMAHSVEIRLPFLDYRILDLMGRVRPEKKISGMEEKYILKKALAPFLPKCTVERAKQPFRAPIGRYLIDGRNEYLTEMLSERELNKFGLFPAKKVDRLVRKLAGSERVSEVEGMALTGILTAQIIYDRFIHDFQPPSRLTVQPNILVDKTSPSENAVSER